MTTPAAIAFDIRPAADVRVALDPDRAGTDAVLDGGTGVKIGVALAIAANVGTEAASEVEVGTGSAVKTAENVGLGSTVTADGSSTEVTRARRVSVGVGSREPTTLIRRVPPHPATSKHASNKNRYPRTWRSIAASSTISS
jgi:hypothetical protein